MAKPEWGTKRVCHSCATKFYDFKKNPILCPQCGTKLDPDGLLKSRRSRSAPKPTPKDAKNSPAKDADVESASDDGDDDDDISDATDDDDLLMDADIDSDDGDEDVSDIVRDSDDDDDRD